MYGYESILSELGRILFGGYFTLMGVNHFAKKDMLVGYAKSKNVPSPEMAVLGTGVLLLVGGISVLLGMDTAGATALTLFLVPVSFKMHAFWAETDPMMKMGDMTNFLKNLALLGATWMMF